MSLKKRLDDIQKQRDQVLLQFRTIETSLKNSLDKNMEFEDNNEELIEKIEYLKEQLKGRIEDVSIQHELDTDRYSEELEYLENKEKLLKKDIEKK